MTEPRYIGSGGDRVGWIDWEGKDGNRVRVYSSLDHDGVAVRLGPRKWVPIYTDGVRHVADTTIVGSPVSASSQPRAAVLASSFPLIKTVQTRQKAWEISIDRTSEMNGKGDHP